MTLIVPANEPARYIVLQGDEIILDGVAQIGEAVGVCMDLAAVYAEGDNAFLAMTMGEAGSYNPLPAVGEWCEAGQIYSDAGNFVICRQSHYRTIYPLVDTPALWSVYRPDASGILDWVANEPVVVGTRRIYDGVLYECIQSHTTQTDWTPPNTPTLWKVVEPEPDEYPAWVQPTGAHDAYNIGDRVTYNGHLWESKIDANVWSPTAYPAGWLDLGVYP